MGKISKLKFIGRHLYGFYQDYNQIKDNLNPYNPLAYTSAWDRGKHSRSRQRELFNKGYSWAQNKYNQKKMEYYPTPSTGKSRKRRRSWVGDKPSKKFKLTTTSRKRRRFKNAKKPKKSLTPKVQT